MQDSLENALIEREDPVEIPEHVEREIVRSWTFIFLYFVTISKSFTNFYYAEYFKEIGMYLIKDDMFITHMAMVAGVVNFLSRMSMGYTFKIFGFKFLYCFNVVLEMLESLAVLYLGDTRVGFAAFLIFLRGSGGTDWLIPRSALHPQLRVLLEAVGNRRRAQGDQVLRLAVFIRKCVPCGAGLSTARK